MSTSQGTRPAWSYMYEKGLVDVMKEHVNIPMYRAQNGWTTEGWRNITINFNDMLLTTHFIKQQVQEKEKELKGSYKIIKEARKNGVGWNDTLGMIIAELNGWKKLIKIRITTKLPSSTFPLYNSLESLYEGNAFILLFIASPLKITSTEPPNMTARPPIERSHFEQSTQNTTVGSDSVGINFGTNPFSPQIEGPEVQSAPRYLNLEEEQQSASGKKCKQNEKKKKEDDYSVEKCIAVVDSIEDLTIEQKADANELFQSEMN
uniref:Myb/SANT-like domain-containing protein n=1 Tax=Setaria italica TaxID=4555 RepID=K4AKM9_SETIT